jgi:hypothetical protein
MLYREIITVCLRIHTKHLNIVCVQNVEFFLLLKLHGMYRDREASEVSRTWNNCSAMLNKP